MPNDLTVYPAREVPLGGLRAMSVRRALPQRELPTVGAWCFLDRFGPQEAVMRVDPHPHIGLQTVTWPLRGEVRHRDSLDSDVVLQPGALNVMTAGHGIAHSEYSLGEEAVTIDALQLWVALPESARDVAPSFESHPTLPTLRLGDATATIVLGELAGVRSPATTFTPIVGAQLELPAHGSASIPLHPTWEHAVVVLAGDAMVDGVHSPAREELLYVAAGAEYLTLESREGATVFLLGGEPFAEPLVMWWNFVGRTHEDIADARAAWEARDARFGAVEGHGDVRVPAPALPSIRLVPRTRRSPRVDQAS